MNPTAQSQAMSQGYSRIKVPVGLMLVKSIHDSYGTVQEMILELVQNAIDAYAHHISLIVDKRTRDITIVDDGDGVSKEKYEAALQSVMRTTKTRDKLGQFGMGMLSPLAKCEWHKLISCPKEGTEYLEWTFDTEAIRSQVDDIYVPHQTRNDICFRANSGGVQKAIRRVEWRTQVEVHRYTDDKFIGRIPPSQAIFDEIVQKYRQKMLENKIKISIKIVSKEGIDSKVALEAESYWGHPLPHKQLSDAKAGMSSFHLFLARKDGKGKYIGQGVSVGEADNAYRFPFKVFARQREVGMLSSGVVEALNSGLFEGDILTEHTKLHSNRRSFEPSDALLGFCLAIEAWYEEVGKEQYEAAMESKGSERYKMLGEDLKNTLENLFKEGKFAGVLKPIQPGLGLKVPSKEGTEKSDELKSEREPSAADKQEKPSTESEPKKPKKQASAKSEELGIEIRYEPIYDERKIWIYEPGILTFNTLHSTWRRCEGEDNRRLLRQLQENIAIMVFKLQEIPEGDWREWAETFAEELIDPMISLLQISDNFQHISRMKRKKEESD